MGGRWSAANAIKTGAGTLLLVQTVRLDNLAQLKCKHLNGYKIQLLLTSAVK